MDQRISLHAAALCAVALLMPPAASAQNGTENYYNPPKIVKQGKTTSPIAGNGTVVVKVLVNADASAKVQGVIRSTNHADDAAALEIAKSSTYRAATRGGKKLTAFYDYTLKFKSGGVSADAGDAAGSGGGGGVAQYEREIRAGNYAGAQSGLKSYVAQHADDARAELALGVASTYLNDFAGASAAFDKAGPIPENYKSLAGKAYADAAAQSMKNNDNAAAVAAAKRAVAIVPSVFTYNTLGTVEDASGDSASAVTDLEKARSLAAADAKLKPADRAHIDANLVSAYLSAGKMDMAKQIAAEAARLDPSQTGGQMMFASFYSKQAATASTAGKYSDAAAAYEQAAVAAPSQAETLYARAALEYLKAKPNPLNDKAKADADKALAANPDSALGNFAEGVSLANQSGKSKDALAYLNKADASAKKSGDTGLTAAIEDVIKQVSGSK